MSRNKLETPLFDAESVNVLSEDCLLGDVCMYTVVRDSICPFFSIINVNIHLLPRYTTVQQLFL